MIRKFLEKDREQLINLLQETHAFTPAEVDVALELVDIFLKNPDQKDYEVYSATDYDDTLLAYVCIGPTPLTVGTYDLYWIAVRADQQRKGIGKELLNFVEAEVKQNNGRLILIETSSQEKYKNTRKFYESTGYQLLSRIRDYYKIGDDLLVYGKYL